MNLIVKITILNLLLALVAFTIGGIRVYHNFRYEVQRETDFSLVESIDQLVIAMETGVPASDLQNALVSIREISAADTVHIAKSVFSDTLAMHPVLKHLELQRKAVQIRPVLNHFFQFAVINVVIEQSDISRISKNILSDLFIVLGVLLLLLNIIISKWLLGPFETTLEKIKNFSLQKGDVPVFPKTSTKEFRQLHAFLTEMLQKNKNDYQALKEFSENASHEMQTPLAIASGKLEILQEDNNLSDKQMALIQSAQEAISRLSKMGESLLLLTKIENLEFRPETPINFSQILRNELRTFSDLAGMKGLRMEEAIATDVQVKINPALAHILIANLMKNSIRHNLSKGWIKVTLSNKSLTISNPGQEPPVPPAQLFSRFQKSNQSEKSMGLGLAIVKKICEVNGFEVTYLYAAGVHEVSVQFAR